MLTFKHFAHINKTRCTTVFKQKLTDWNLMEWGCALAGEVGELCNMAKKLSRRQQHIKITQKRDSLVTDEKIMLEIGDCGVYLDLLAQRAGFKLEDCVRMAFNRKSEEMKSKLRV